MQSLDKTVINIDLPKQIEKDLDQKVNNLRTKEDCAFFHCEDGIIRSARITKRGGLKKRSIRVF